jgi:hypothetical protein
MNCSGFVRILADFEDGKLSAGQQSAAEAHLGKCSDCRRLLDIVRGKANPLPEDKRDELTRSILDCTSGPVCSRVESCLWDFVEGGLSAEDCQLITLHLDHCEDCRSIARDMKVMQEVLPTMAGIEPGGSFTREVVSLTSGWRSYQPGLRIRLLAWWNRTIQRPHFSLEAAYLGTLFFVLVFSSPFMPLRNVTFDRISSAAIQPSSKHLLSMWAGARAPVSSCLDKITSVMASQGQTVSRSLGKLTCDWEQVSISMADRSIQAIRECPRKAAVALLTIRTLVHSWFLRTKL